MLLIDLVWISGHAKSRSCDSRVFLCAKIFQRVQRNQAHPDAAG